MLHVKQLCDIYLGRKGGGAIATLGLEKFEGINEKCSSYTSTNVAGNLKISAFCSTAIWYAEKSGCIS